MNLQTEKEAYKKKIYQASKDEIDKESYRFALFSANIKNFLPHIPISNYGELFRESLYHRRISSLEQYDLDYLKKNRIINNSSINLKQKETHPPTLFTSFHLGSYRLFNSILYELGYKIVIIMAESVFIKQQNDILDRVKPILEGTKESDFIILNVKDRKSIFKLKNLIEQGYIMTVYLDGNTGLNSEHIDFSKSYIPIKFLNNTIYVKNGVGKLASLMDANIVPVISYRDKNECNVMEFHKEIKISDYTNKAEFSIKSIELNYKLFEEKLINYPMQWECWYYIHNWFKRNYNTTFKLQYNFSNIFNRERYTTFKLGESLFIFDLYDYLSYPANDFLISAIEKDDFSQIDISLLKELKHKNIVI